MKRVIPEEELRELLICPRCKSKYKEPKKLSPNCGTLCSECIFELTDDNNEWLVCFFCRKKHAIPASGLASDKEVEHLLAICAQAEIIYQNDDLKKLMENKSELVKLHEEFTESKNALEADLNNFCDEMKSKIDLKTELLIEQINTLKSEFSNRINDYKLDSQNYINENKTILDRIVNNFEEFYEKYKDIFDTTQTEFENEITKEIEKVDVELKNVDFDNFNNKILTFSENYETLSDTSIIGIFKRYYS